MPAQTMRQQRDDALSCAIKLAEEGRQARAQLAELRRAFDERTLTRDLDRIADEPAERIGAYLAAALHLKRDPEHADRWRTTWGTKTNQGLARTVARTFSEALLHAAQGAQSC